MTTIDSIEINVIIKHIISYLPDDDVVHFALTSKKFYRKIHSMLDYHAQQFIDMNKEEKYRKGRFLSIKTIKKRYFRYACQSGSIILINRMLKSGVVNYEWGLFGACRGSHTNIIDMMIKKGTSNYNIGLFGACLGGHMDIVNLMIAKGADDYYMALQAACKGGHIEIVNMMIKLGANYCVNCGKNAKNHNKL